MDSKVLWAMYDDVETMQLRLAPVVRQDAGKLESEMANPQLLHAYESAWALSLFLYSAARDAEKREGK